MGGKRTSLAAFGESKTLYEWSIDPRCHDATAVIIRGCGSCSETIEILDIDKFLNEKVNEWTP